MGLPSKSSGSKKEALAKEMARNKYDVTTGHEKCHKGKRTHAMTESHLLGDSDIKGESGKVTFQWGPQGGPNVEARPTSHPQAQGAKENEARKTAQVDPSGPRERAWEHLAHFFVRLYSLASICSSLLVLEKKV